MGKKAKNSDVVKYDGDNERVNAILEHFPNCVLYMVNGSRGRLPIAVEVGTKRPKEAALRIYNGDEVA